MTLNELRDRLASLHEQATTLQNDAKDRDMTEEEQNSLDGFLNEMESIAPQIDRLARLENVTKVVTAPAAPRAKPGTTPAQPDPTPNTRYPTQREKAQAGFQHPGEFYASVRSASRGHIDPRLIKGSTTTYGSEGVGEDGGFAVPPEWRSSIMDLAFGEESLYARTDQQTTSSNQITVPVTEAPQWGNPGGITTAWLEEAGALTEQKPALKTITVRANKLGALVYMTDELLEDGVAMGRFIQTKAPMAIEFAVSDAIVSGNGVGKPLGIINAPGTVTIADRETTSIVTPLDLVSMWGRMPARLRSNAVWLMNQDVETTLPLLSLKVRNVANSENVGGWPIFIPPGGLPNSPGGTLLGRPIVVTESCSAIGAVGDIILTNLSWYLTLVKAGGIRAETSIHVEFKQDITAFRFIFRVGGQPWLSAPVARKNGSATFSSAVMLPT